MNILLQLLKLASGTLLMLGGLLAVLVGLTFVLDPASSQMADDMDPFGAPLSRFHSLVFVVVSSVIAWLGLYLLRPRCSRSSFELRH